MCIFTILVFFASTPHQGRVWCGILTGLILPCSRQALAVHFGTFLFRCPQCIQGHPILFLICQMRSSPMCCTAGNSAEGRTLTLGAEEHIPRNHTISKQDLKISPATSSMGRVCRNLNGRVLSLLQATEILSATPGTCSATGLSWKPKLLP